MNFYFKKTLGGKAGPVQIY